MKLENMKIYIITTSHLEMIMFKAMFKQYSNIEVVINEFSKFMDENPYVECIVSPGNSYGIMNGVYDAAISNYFGSDFQEKVQQCIDKNCEYLFGKSDCLRVIYLS